MQLIGVLLSLPRTLHHVSTMMLVSALSMFVAVVCSIAFAGGEDHPARGPRGLYPYLGPVSLVRSLFSFHILIVK